MPTLAVTLSESLRPEIDAQGLRANFTNRSICRWCGVLARMEETGIRVDPEQLRVLSGRMEEEIARLSARNLRAGREAVQHQFAATIRQGFV